MDMVKWQTVRLGKIVSTNQSTYSLKENWKFVNYLDTGNITMNQVDEIQYINTSIDKLPSRARRKVKLNSIIYSTVRPNQLHYGIIKNKPENFLVSTGFTVIDVDFDKAVPDYIYYVLTQQEITEYLQSIAEQSVSAYPSIKPSDIEKLEFLLPDRKTQEKIVSILRSIDEKIAQNNEINNNLKQQAQAIFKAWFVDFEPFNGEMPSDWITGTVDNLGTEIICGKTPSTKKKEYYGGNIPFITIPDMHGCVYNVSTERYLSAAGVASQPKKTLPPNTICVSCIGTAGLVTLVSEKSQSNQQINSIVPKEGISSYYIYLLMQTLSETINKLGQSGSTIVNLNKTQFSKIQVAIPSEQVLYNFDTLCKPLFEMIHSNQKENIKLANLRDALLAKLMAGELDISDIDL